MNKEKKDAKEKMGVRKNPSKIFAALIPVYILMIGLTLQNEARLA
jgi:hypothetical protein